MNQFYNIWNYDYIQQQAQIEHHNAQVKQVQDTAKALYESKLSASMKILNPTIRRRHGNGKQRTQYR